MLHRKKVYYTLISLPSNESLNEIVQNSILDKLMNEISKCQIEKKKRNQFFKFKKKKKVTSSASNKDEYIKEEKKIFFKLYFSKTLIKTLSRPIRR
ncbi:hypothetical protein A3Q56_08051 [Intoshia linei]|uniref:Uncharacterized protein n=1 Tax=Intoshia linei TaxID=1819745 RepID=A0A177ARU7_9BILA|nr:hypothetical protein A3Q56_08051 [Intoshia linei]